MPQELYYFIFQTGAGWLGVAASPRGLRRLTLPQASEPEASRRLGFTQKEATWSPQPFQDLAARLGDYFAGHAVAFPDELDLCGATAFQRRVWAATRLIPRGETRSYAWVAAEIKQPGAARAVGQALGRNPLPVIIPCHRVLAAGGGLGGFTGGLAMKEYLLGLETGTGIRSQYYV